MKKLIAIVLSSLLLIGAAVGGTLALASDEERTVNVYTAGNIDIALVNGENEQLTLFPAVYNFTDYDTAEKAFAKTDANGYWTALRNVYQKDLAVKNVGKNDAFIRVIVAYENPKIDDTKYFFNECVVLNEVTAGITKTPLGNAMIDGTNYALVSYQFNGAVTPDANAKHVVLRQLALKTGTTSEQMAKIGGAYDIMVCAQAVQTDSVNDATAMLNAAFYQLDGTMHPWVVATAASDYKATEFPGIYTGKEARTYYVFSKNGLMNLNNLLGSISTGEGVPAQIKLMADIDLLGEVWKPIQKTWVTFEGNGHTIKNLNAPGMDAAGRRSGFWAYAGGVKINGLTLENVTVNGSQAGIFAGSAEGLTITNCYLKGNNTVNFVAGVETWNGIGAITGVAIGSDINVTILKGATVTLNRGTMVTDLGCKYIDDFTGHIAANRGTVVNNGKVVSTGSIFYAVSTTAELIDAIKNASDGDKLLVAPGNYSLHFTNDTTFNVDNLTIVGVAGENPVTFTITSTEASYGRIQGNNVTFENINFVNVNGSVGATGKATYNNCTFAGRLELASSGGAETYVNNCKMNNIHTSTDMNAGAAYVKGSTMVLAEYNAQAAMNFENCAIGTLISHGGNTVLTNCKVDSIVIKGGTVVEVNN